MTKDIPTFVSRTTDGYWVFRDVWQFFDELPNIININNELPIEPEPDTSTSPSFGVHVIRTTEGFFVENAYAPPDDRWSSITPEEFSRVSGFPTDVLDELPIETLPGSSLKIAQAKNIQSQDTIMGNEVMVMA